MKNKSIAKWATIAYVTGGLAIALCLYTVAMYTEGIKAGRMIEAATIKRVVNPNKEDIQAEIKRQAELFGVNVQLALDLAQCESNFDWNAKNPTSTARGVYQWTIASWDATLSAKAGIERNNWEANIREAMIKLANQEYSHWADCLN